MMYDSTLLKLAEAEGFHAALLTPEQVPVNPKFRAFCEENLCGNYNANYACPPACGTVEELHQKLLAEDQILIIQTIWPIDGYENKTAVRKAKETHNGMVFRLKSKIEQQGYIGFCAGYNGCPLCNPCKQKKNQPCAHPDQKLSCMSAYCIDVAELAKRCNLTFEWTPKQLHLFGMIALHQEHEKKC